MTSKPKSTPLTRRRATKRGVWQFDFLRALESGATVTDAATVARVTRQAVYAAKLASPTFRAECSRCFDVGTKMLLAASQSTPTPVRREATFWSI
jgi:hypothetical protein